MREEWLLQDGVHVQELSYPQRHKGSCTRAGKAVTLAANHWLVWWTVTQSAHLTPHRGSPCTRDSPPYQNQERTPASQPSRSASPSFEQEQRPATYVQGMLLHTKVHTNPSTSHPTPPPSHLPPHPLPIPPPHLK